LVPRWCLGVELDEHMAARSRRRLAQFNDHVPVLCADFLKTTGPLLAQALNADDNGEVRGNGTSRVCAAAVLNGTGPDAMGPAGRGGASAHSHGGDGKGRASWPPWVGHGPKRKTRVLVVGGPPYTDYEGIAAPAGEEERPLESSELGGGQQCGTGSGTGSGPTSRVSTRGSDTVVVAANGAAAAAPSRVTSARANVPPEAMSAAVTQNRQVPAARISGCSGAAALFRSLPLRFVLHAVLVLGADRVTFLLPKRCAKPAFADAVFAALEKEEAVANGGNEGASQDKAVNNDETEDSAEGEAVGGRRVRSRLSGAEEEPEDKGDVQEAPPKENCRCSGLRWTSDKRWAVSWVDAPDKRFRFRGRFVPQPSIIWALTRSECLRV